MVGLARAEELELPPVVGRRVVPAEVATLEHFAWVGYRAGEAVAHAGRFYRLEVVRRVEVGEQDAVYCIGVGDVLAWIADLYQIFDTALAAPHRTPSDQPTAKRVG